jgi:hypothetical protein
VICFDVLGTRKCQNFKFLTKSRFTTNRTCYTLLNFRKNPTGGVSIEMAEPIHIAEMSIIEGNIGKLLAIFIPYLLNGVLSHAVYLSSILKIRLNDESFVFQ